MKLMILDNVILEDEDDGIIYTKQKILRIENNNEVIYFDLIDFRINTYNVIVTEKTKILEVF